MTANPKILPGLSIAEAQKRRQKFGPNELEIKSDFSSFKIFIRQFRSPLVYILLLAGLATLFLSRLTDATVIFLAVVLNALLGFYQERKAHLALAQLSKLLAPKARVIRGGIQKIIEAKDLVPADLVLLDNGETVPADGVLIKASDFSVNEAILSGESFPAEKQKGEEVYMGTVAASGIGTMVVEATGVNTKMGKMGRRVEEMGEELTPLQGQLGNLARILAILVGLMAGVIFGLGWLRGYPAAEMFTISIAVAVAAIPEGLIVTLTVILALGMQKILHQQALVRRLLAAETLGSVNVICLDKTGTLTKGELEVAEADFTDDELGVRAAVLANNRRDPLELALWQWAENKLSGKGVKALLEEFPRLGEIPFSAKTKMAASWHKNPGGKSLTFFVIGAPEILIANCKLQIANRKKWLKKFANYGGQGYRLVGLASKKLQTPNSRLRTEDITDLKWLGVVAFEDPVRSEVKGVLQECKKAGITVKIITGDYPATAQAVAKRLQMTLDLDGARLGKISDKVLRKIVADGVIDGPELDQLSDRQLEEVIDQLVLFARTDPEHKLRLVNTLKRKGGVVAMMGDGVNDALALAKADIGIVVNEAADVAKETADMVLLDSNFRTIIAAIKEGRNIFENIKKVVLYLLSDSFTEVILIGGALFLGLPLPFTAAQILWVNLIEDSLPAMALAFEPTAEELMSQPPRPRQAPILDSRLKMLIFLVSLVSDGFLLILFIILTQKGYPAGYLNTVMFVALGINSLFMVFACRSLQRSIFSYSFWTNWLLNLSVGGGFILLMLAVYLPFWQKILKTWPLGGGEWLLLLGIGLFDLLVVEGLKFLIIKRETFR